MKFCENCDNMYYLKNLEDDKLVYYCRHCGNHDYNLGLNAAKVQIDYTFSELNKNKKWNMPNKWYTISYPNVDIVFIDTNFYWLSESVIQKQL